MSKARKPQRKAPKRVTLAELKRMAVKDAAVVRGLVSPKGANARSRATLDDTLAQLGVTLSERDMKALRAALGGKVGAVEMDKTLLRSIANSRSKFGDWGRWMGMWKA